MGIGPVGNRAGKSGEYLAPPVDAKKNGESLNVRKLDITYLKHVSRKRAFGLAVTGLALIAICVTGIVRPRVPFFPRRQGMLVVLGERGFKEQIYRCSHPAEVKGSKLLRQGIGVFYAASNVEELLSRRLLGLPEYTGSHRRIGFTRWDSCEGEHFIRGRDIHSLALRESSVLEFHDGGYLSAIGRTLTDIANAYIGERYIALPVNAYLSDLKIWNSLYLPSSEGLDSLSLSVSVVSNFLHSISLNGELGYRVVNSDLDSHSASGERVGGNIDPIGCIDDLLHLNGAALGIVIHKASLQAGHYGQYASKGNHEPVVNSGFFGLIFAAVLIIAYRFIPVGLGCWQFWFHYGLVEGGIRHLFASAVCGIIGIGIGDYLLHLGLSMGGWFR